MPVCVTPHQIRNEIRTFLGLTIFCDFSPVCCLNVGSSGHILVCLTCADSWLREGWSVCSPRVSECCWPGDTTRAAGAGVSSSSFWPNVFCTKIWAHLAPSTSSDTPQPPPVAQMTNQALTHYSVCRRDLYSCCLPFPTQAAVPGRRLTGEPKRRHISTVALCAKIWLCLSICQHLLSDLSIAGTSHGLKVAPWTGGLNATHNCFSTWGCEAFVCMLAWT